MTDEETEISLEMVKELIEEAKILKQRIDHLESENFDLQKATEDPTILMRKQGWRTFVTPHADETFDPLNRDMTDVGFGGPFDGSGEMISKSRYEELQEWEDAERGMRP
jgi:hypothetical protein